MLEISNDSCAELLSENGVLDSQWAEFSPRQGQQQMAALVNTAIHAKTSLIVEAPSGSGKTIAYLTPVICSSSKAIISTASRYLQRQLYEKDLPNLQHQLNSNKTVAVLEGRSHYLCPYYLEKHTAELKEPTHRHHKLRQNLQQVAYQYGRTGSGILALLAPTLDEQSRSYLTASTQDCLGKRCPQYTRCPIIIARNNALQADIVIVNHSLLFSDQVLKEHQLSGLLPNADVVVVDEAHRISDFAQSIVGEHLSSATIVRLCRDIERALRTYAPEESHLLKKTQQFRAGIETLAVTVAAFEQYQQSQHIQVTSQLLGAVRSLAKHLKLVGERDYSLTELYARTEVLADTLSTILNGDGLTWVQLLGRGFIIRTVPLQLAERISRLVNQNTSAWVFTSATLSVNKKVDRFRQALGLFDANFHCVDSEIDFQNQALLYTPRLALEPNQSEFYRRYAQALSELYTAANGRVLCLFSSYHHLRQTAAILRSSGFECMEYTQTMNAASDKIQLIEQFRQSPKAILLATGSFWEGLDLSGVPIAAVAIDKLPFAHVNDPLIRFRSLELQVRGIDSFRGFLLPDAVIRLRQGVGRLLRRATDRGVIMIADSRLENRQYGDSFLNSLPAMPRTNKIDKVIEFYQQGENK